jgi:1,5-anhydro-D-fructose reductase (1,5-anhydro-D-mannitol-forming)
MPGYGFDMRFHLVLERATIDFDMRRTPTLRLYPAEGEAIVPDCEPGDGYSQEIAHFAGQIRGQSLPVVVTPEQAWNSLRIVEAERESVRTGERVFVDGTEDECDAMR